MTNILGDEVVAREFAYHLGNKGLARNLAMAMVFSFVLSPF